MLRWASIWVLLGGTPLPATAGVVVNELLPDVSGSDAGHEWVELLNPDAAPVDLEGWTLQVASSGAAFQVRYTFAPVLLDAGAYLVLGEPSVTPADQVAASLAMGNASGSTGDAVRLVDATGAVVDTVIYGPNNGDGFLDDTEQEADSVAPVPEADASLARFPDGTDTDRSGDDFLLARTPTPGGANALGDTGDTGHARPGECTSGIQALGVVINEFLPDAAGGDDGFEWAELHNTRSTTIDLSDWAVASGTQSFSTRGLIPRGTQLVAGGFLVVGQSLLQEVQVEAPGFVLGNASSNSDAVRLEDCLGNPVDTVVYGSPNSDGWGDDVSDLASSLAPTPAEGRSIARVEDGVDSDQSGLDFVLAELPTPGASNTSPPEGCGGPESGIVINELLPDPDGSDDDAEWIELYHAGPATVDLTGWALEAGTQSYGVLYRWDAGSIDPGTFVLIGGSLVDGAQGPLSGTLGNATSNADAVRLVDCRGLPADTVVYGAANDDGFLDDGGEPAESLAPKPESGASLARLADGFDTDLSGSDFVVSTSPTPGAPNPAIEPVVCVPSAGHVVLNEFLPDPEGVDDGLEWIELYNRSEEPASLAGWSISAGTSDYEDLDVTLPGGLEIPARGFWVVGGSSVPEADHVADGLSIGNGTDGDGIRLFDCEGTPVDTVVYGESNEDGLVDDRGVAGEPAGEPAASQSLARRADGLDTDEADDWKVTGAPTPGASNASSGGGSLEGPSGCGCGGSGQPPPEDRSAAGGKPPGEGCRTAPTPWGGLELFAGWVALVRRRRRTQPADPIEARACDG